MRHVLGVLSIALAGAGCDPEKGAADGGPPDATVDATVDAMATTDEGPATVDHPAPPDAGTPSIDRPDVPDVGIVGDDNPAPSACPLTSAVPLAQHLSGEGPLLRDAGGPAGTFRESLDLYLPAGRVAGAPVVLAFATSWPRNALTVVEGHFNADLGVTGLAWTSTYGGVLSFTGGMAAPSGALALHLAGNLSVGTDVIDYAEADVTLCPAGEAPAATLRSDHAITPRGVVDLVPSAPIAGDVGVVRLMAGGAVVPSDALVHDGVLTLTARAWLASGTAVTVDLGGLRDVMGRAFALDGAVSSLATTAVIADREFTAAPPAGAVASDASFTAAAGALRNMPYPIGPFRLLLALGDLGAAAHLRVDANLTCDAQTTAWLVAADGTHAALAWESVTDAGSPFARTARAAVSGSGPWWLLMESSTTPPRPGYLPPPVCTVAIDRIGTE